MEKIITAYLDGEKFKCMCGKEHWVGVIRRTKLGVRNTTVYCEAAKDIITVFDKSDILTYGNLEI